MSKDTRVAPLMRLVLVMMVDVEQCDGPRATTVMLHALQRVSVMRTQHIRDIAIGHITKCTRTADVTASMLLRLPCLSVHVINAACDSPVET